MHDSQNSAGQPVFASSSAAPRGRPAQTPGAIAPGWLSSLLHEIGHRALNARDPLGRMLDDPHSTDALNSAASNLMSVMGMPGGCGSGPDGQHGRIGRPAGLGAVGRAEQVLAASRSHAMSAVVVPLPGSSEIAVTQASRRRRFPKGVTSIIRERQRRSRAVGAAKPHLDLTTALPLVLGALQALPRARCAAMAADWVALLTAPNSAELRAVVTLTLPAQWGGV